MYDMETATATSTLGDQLGPSKGPRAFSKPQASARHKLYRTAVGQLLWATSVRPDISFVVTELSRSLQAPTKQDEKQLKQVLRYLKGTLHFTISLQPPRKRVIEGASSIQIQACFDSAWARSSQTEKATSGVSLSLWEVPLATSSRVQASHAFSIAEAELYAMGMAVYDSLHLKSFLQEMPLSQLAKPVELTVYTDSSSGKALVSKLGLTRKSKHVQLRYLFRTALLADGQLQLRKIPPSKNPATMLTNNLPASILHKLLPKLGVRTRAADFKDLLSVVNLEMLASPRAEQGSFFIGTMAKHPVSAQLVASRVASRSLHSNSFPQPSQEAASNLQSSQRTFSLSSFWRSLFSVVALLCANLSATDSLVDFKICRFLLSGTRSLTQLCFDAVIVFKQRAFRTTFWTRASRTRTSSLALGSLLTASLQRTMLNTNPRTPVQLSASSPTLPRTALCTHSWKTRFLTLLLSACLGWVASAYQDHSFTVKASFAQTSNSSSFPTSVSASTSLKQRRWPTSRMISLSHSCLPMKRTPCHQLCCSMSWKGCFSTMSLKRFQTGLTHTGLKTIFPRFQRRMSFSSG